MTKPKQFSLKDATHPTDRHRPVTRTFGPAGEALPETGQEQADAAAEWLKHLHAGRLAYSLRVGRQFGVTVALR